MSVQILKGFAPGNITVKHAEFLRHRQSTSIQPKTDHVQCQPNKFQYTYSTPALPSNSLHIIEIESSVTEDDDQTPLLKITSPTCTTETFQRQQAISTADS